MADVFSGSGGESLALLSPVMVGQFLPNIDGALNVPTAGFRVPWGGAAVMNRYSYGAGSYGGSGSAYAPQDGNALAIGGALSEIMSTVSGYLSAVSQLMVGPAGPRGPSGPPGAYVIGDIGALGFPGQDGEDGEDAFNNIDLPVPSGGWEGAFSSNNPSGGYVSWSSFTITYQGVDYTIDANPSGTTEAFIYWDQNSSPTTLQATSTLGNATGAERWIVCVNSGGTAEPAMFQKALNGGIITAASIIASHLNVSNLSAISANMGTITAGSISAALVTAGTLVADRISSATLAGIVASVQAPTALTQITTPISYLETGTWSTTDTNYDLFLVESDTQEVQVDLQIKSDGTYGAFDQSGIQVYLLDATATELYTSSWYYTNDDDEYHILRFTFVPANEGFDVDDEATVGIRMGSEEGRYVYCKGQILTTRAATGSVTK